MRFIKPIEVRWSDIDANQHLANTAYMAYMSHTRTAWLTEHGFGMDWMRKHKIGPVLMRESLHYFREVLPGQTVFIEVEITGISQDGTLFAFEQRMYNKDGKNMAFYQVIGLWLDLKTRKKTAPPSELMDLVNQIKKSTGFKTLNYSDLRIQGIEPVLADHELKTTIEKYYSQAYN